MFTTRFFSVGPPNSTIQTSPWYGELKLPWSVRQYTFRPSRISAGYFYCFFTYNVTKSPERQQEFRSLDTFWQTTFSQTPSVPHYSKALNRSSSRNKRSSCDFLKRGRTHRLGLLFLRPKKGGTSIQGFRVI